MSTRTPLAWLIGALATLLPARLLAETPAESPARSVAELTQGAAQTIGQELREIGELFRDIEGEAIGPRLWALALELADLGLIIVVTIGLLLVLRPLARPVFNRAEGWAQRGDARLRTVRRTVGVLGAAAADLATIFLAWIAGYAIALSLVGEVGGIEARESLFLNAFLMVEGFKALLRILFAPRNPHLRLIATDDEHATYWGKRLARMSGLIGYGLLFIGPFVTMAVAEGLGQLAVLLVMVLAFGYAVVIALRNRHDVRERLQASAAESRVLFTRTILSSLAWVWHWVVILYFGALAVVTITQPDAALAFMAQATLQTALAIGIGAFLAIVLTQATARRIRLSERNRRHFPLLEQRLNSYLPIVLKIARTAILIVVIATVLDAWQLFDFTGWLASEGGLQTLGVILSVTLVLLAATAVWLLAASFIEHRLNPDVGHGTPSAREQTLLTLFRNAIAIVLVTMTTMIVLAEIGINIGPLIAGAGVLGLAIGFGAQKLVQDIITGVFIQLENAIDVGDIVTAGGVTGTVEKLTIRSVNIRDLFGTYHFIPFSSVDSVSNFTRHFAYHVGSYGVAYREDVDQVTPVLEAAYEDLKQHPDPDIRNALYGDFAVDGVVSLGDSSVNIRVRIKTAPGMQWAIGRAYNGLVKKRLDAAGIEIPFPHRTLYFGEDHQGQAPPLRLARAGATSPNHAAGATPTAPTASDRVHHDPTDD
ncbi:mechanosensitive ion channel domain-containing protein [Halorhodospira sp. 9622]|uniref:mechanosensitive ion channel domain-containing protein n=2 Tax=Halorhodospira TaxID=85108 RepID=UPI001EE814B0|nr:mechanosensitive ion channel [Halorhodospira sp. 9622]